jgi:hypothetical protein
MIQSERRGFFASLYDVSFRTFVTPAIVEVVYIIALIIVAIWSIVFLVSGFAPSNGFDAAAGPSAGNIVLHIIVTPIIFFSGRWPRASTSSSSWPCSASPKTLRRYAKRRTFRLRPPPPPAHTGR